MEKETAFVMPGKEFNKMFARNLLRQMEKNDITKQELAQKVGVSPSSITHWTSGRLVPRMDKVDRLCEIFGCYRSDLITDKGEDSPYYLNRYAEELAEFLHQSPEYRVLFDASRKVKPEDIQIVKEILDRFRNGNN